MWKRFVFRVLVVVCFSGVVLGVENFEPKELVSNPMFKAAETEKLPVGWSVWKPVWDKAACRFKSVGEGLLVEAEDPYAVGGIIQEIKDIKPGQAYAVKAVCQLRDVPTPYPSVLVRISWTQKGKPLHPAGMLVRGQVLTGGIASFEDVLVAPEAADGAQLSLEVKWPGGGSVIWKQASLQATSRPEPRKVKVGTVYLRPRNSTPENNIKLWCEQIDAAGKLGLDVVCLGEAMTMVGTDCSVKDCAEPMPGPATRQIADAARRNRIWVVAGLTEQVGDVVYNTAVLLDRRGRIAGKYRKVHLPREEWTNGIRPGGEYPVFETDFGKVAIQICYDWFFPEPAQIFALKGAEIIFAPTWGNTLPDEAGRVDGESVFRVRARDNGVYMVPSVYSGNSLVIDPMGRILAHSGGKEGVFWAEIDLNARESLEWVGYWRSIGPRHRMVESYGPLLKAPQGSKY
ncbi:MAG TPA: carbon-nitrogen hydrolase family protein [Sedimentisphaerales bacterium]|nr:carbon-nitrogen hydrolase family protein [Sedimentisphaerales bacterium]